MRITLVTAGSRGDVQPYAALALGLRRAGHQVLLAASENFAGLAAQHGLDFHPLRGDFRALLETKAGQRFVATPNFIAGLLHVRRMLGPFLAQMTRDIGAACRPAAVIVSHAALTLFTSTVAQRTGAGFFGSGVQPLAPTREFPNPILGSTLSLGGRYNLLTTRALQWAGWLAFKPVINRWRKEEFGLPPQTFRRLAAWAEPKPAVFGYSRRVAPRPADWADNYFVSGYWMLDEGPGWQPPAALQRFLEAGPPPVAVGFGSMSDRDPQGRTRIVLRALELSGQRGVLLAGWGGLGNLAPPDGVLQIEAAPHGWLFPRMAAAVHHGGSGTTAASLHAGVPTVAVPFIADQPFWGGRVAALGVGPAPLPRKRLTAEALAARIDQAVNDRDMRARAQALGAALRAEDGVTRAVEIIENGL